MLCMLDGVLCAMGYARWAMRDLDTGCAMHAMHAHVRARIQTHLRVRICVLPSACACRYAYLYSQAHRIHVVRNVSDV
jgi:hypothetical protein